MKVTQLCKGQYEVVTEGSILGWVDLELLPAPDGTETIKEQYVAKPAGHRAALAARTMGEATAYLAGTFN